MCVRVRVRICVFLCAHVWGVLCVFVHALNQAYRDGNGWRIA